jgi:hypothetical protein
MLFLASEILIGFIANWKLDRPVWRLSVRSCMHFQTSRTAPVLYWSLWFFQKFFTTPKHANIERSSYSSMLNIAESLPDPESVPCNSSNWVPINSHRFLSILEFRELSRCGIGRTSTEFRNRTESGGIKRNWTRFLEFRSGIQCNNREWAIATTGCWLNPEILGIPRNWFRETVLLVETDSENIRNWRELIPGAEPVPPCSTSRNRIYSPDIASFQQFQCFQWSRNMSLDVSDSCYPTLSQTHL